MKGVSYLVDESGKKTHVVLDLDLWREWQHLSPDDVLLAASVDDLNHELSDLEQDLAPAELGAWLAAFDNA